MNTRMIGSRWVSRASGFEAEVRGVDADTVRYVWIEQVEDACTLGTFQLPQAKFLDAFEPVS